MKFKETKITAILAVVFVLVVVSMSAYAADLTVPHTFSPGTAAKSSEVNENFTTIYNEVNALKKQLSNDWIKLLDNASYSGCYEEHKYTPLATGQFSQVKAVYKSGYITCNTSNYPETSSNPYKWQLCNPEGGAVAFELKKNDAYLLSQSDYQHIATGCLNPSTPTGDIVCNLNFSIITGDTLTPTWYENSRSSTCGDNGGQIFIELWAKP